MIGAMGDHELYCAAYSTKDQPHVVGLLTTLIDGMRAKEQDILQAREAGENIDAMEEARRILHRLISCTNRRMHKGFPEMLSYLLMKPMEYSSHEFANEALPVTSFGCQNRFQNRFKKGTQKVRTSAAELLSLGTFLSMGTGSALSDDKIDQAWARGQTGASIGNHGASGRGRVR